MSKLRYSEDAPRPGRLGEWLRQLREARDLPLRAVASAAGMDLAHLHKIEHGLRVPTEEQTAHLARFFQLDPTEMQARRIAEKFRLEYAGNPAATDAIGLLAEEAGVYQAGGGRPNPSPQPAPLKRTREKTSGAAGHTQGSR